MRAMGFEDFRVVLSGRDKNFVETFEWLLAESGAVEVLGVNGASRFIRYCTISDGPHIFELELEWIGRSAIRLSCRFALCHPRSGK